MKTITKFLSVFSLIALLALAFATPAMAFDGRTGENIEIKAGEVIEDDVYVTANNFVLNGTVMGDLIVFGTSITINGIVDGDLMAAGQTVIINGTVTDDARIAGAVLQINNTASIGGDLVAGGASLEARTGSSIGGELAVGAGQAVLDGEISGDVLAGAGSLELNGVFGGDVSAQVGDPQDGGMPPSIFMPQSNIQFPKVKPGFSISESAKINGDLEYTQSQEIKIPTNAVGGKITRSIPVVDPARVYQEPTATEIAANWTLDLLRTIITLILFGLLLGWIAPAFMKTNMEKIQTQPAATLGWGVVAYAAFFFSLLVILVGVIAGGVFFGVLTLGGLSGTIIWLGILSIFALIVGFTLVTVFLTKIIVAWLSGKLILARINPALADHKIWPLVLGVSMVALLIALPYVGWLFGILVMFLGLGALWMWGRDVRIKPNII